LFPSYTGQSENEFASRAGSGTCQMPDVTMETIAAVKHVWSQ